MKRLSAWWFAPAPAERLAALRVLIGGFALAYLGLRLPELAASAQLPSADFAPVGICRVLDVPLPAWLAVVIALGTCALLVGFVAGFRARVVAPLAALALLWTLTYRSCWGQVFHTENLLALHVLVLACAPADRKSPPDACGWPIKLLVSVTAATYLVAGITKLRSAGLGWFDGSLLRDGVAVDALRKALVGEGAGPLARTLLDHPGAFTLISIATLVIELGAPLALFGGRTARTWTVAAWGFHVGIALVMKITFPYPLLGFAFLPLFRVETLLRLDRRRKGMPASA